MKCGGEQSDGHHSLNSAIEAASDIESGAQDPIQIIDVTGDIILANGSLTDAIMDFRDRSKR